MSRFFTYLDILEGKVPEDFGVSVVKGSSLTIPGQGSDLALIISSIVKLPPLDERTFDTPSGVEPDMRSLAVKTELEGLYPAEGSNLADDAKERQNARKLAMKENEEKEKEPATSTPDE